MSSYVPTPRFSIGQPVRVRLGKRNRTPHEGTIRDIIWHFKDQRYNYYLEEDGKKVSKRYFDDDLDPIGSFDHSKRQMTTLPLPAKLPMWHLCNFKTTQPELRAFLGEPHFVETDTHRTYGGNEEGWAYTLPSGQRVVVVLRVPYNMAVFTADPADLDPVLRALHIAGDDSRLQRYHEPVPIL